jgi:hypothetical protein
MIAILSVTVSTTEISAGGGVKANGIKELEGSDNPNDLISVLAKNSLALPGMAKDMNILRQNMVALVKLERGVDDEKDLQKQGDFFKSSDALESQIEDQRKTTSPTAAGKGKNTSPTNESTSSKTKKEGPV